MTFSQQPDRLCFIELFQFQYRRSYINDGAIHEQLSRPLIGNLVDRTGLWSVFNDLNDSLDSWNRHNAGDLGE